MELSERQQKFFNFVRDMHGDQMREFTGSPYWEHLWDVAEIVAEVEYVFEWNETHYDNDNLLIDIALGHDLLEDTECDEKLLCTTLKEFGYETPENLLISQCIYELTDQFTSEKYPVFNRKERKLMESQRLTGINGISQTVKYADIIDNVGCVVIENEGFARKFVPECAYLFSKLTKGDKKIRQRCQRTLKSFKFNY